MSTPKPETTKAHQSTTQLRRRLYIDVIVFGTLVALAIFGVSITEYSAQQGYRYWLAVGVLIGGTGIVTTWLRTRRQGEPQLPVLRKLMLHWGSLFLALYLVFLLHQSTGRLNNADAGLIALAMVALVTFLAGVHFDWHFSLVGIVLGVGVAAAALVETYFWIVLVAGALVAVVGFAIYWWSYQIERSNAPQEDPERD